VLSARCFRTVFNLDNKWGLKLFFQEPAEAGAQLRNNLDVAGFVAFGANAAFKRNALVFRQAFETWGLDVLEVGEQVRTACIWSDEAEAFSVVEPFNYTCLTAHVISFYFKNRQDCLGALETKKLKPKEKKQND
jgi:hypothetical protein